MRRLLLRVGCRLAGAATLVSIAGSAACGPSPADVVRLRDEGDDGPRRLAEIVRDRKGAVQREAARALVTLTRRGRQVGLELLVEALSASHPEGFQPLVEWLALELGEGMKLPRSAADNPALSFKDAAYLLASSHLTAVSRSARETLDRALDTWLRESPMERLDDTRQRYSVRALLAYRGRASAKVLLRHIDSDDDWRRALALVNAEGDPDTQHAAGVELTKLADAMRTAAWREKKRLAVRAADTKARIDPTPDQLDAQVSRIQSSDLQAIFVLLAKHRYPESVPTLLAAAEDRDLSTSDRAAALQALGTCAQDLDDTQIDRILTLAAANPPHPDGIASHAYACITHAPRGRPKLWTLVGAPPSWGHRSQAASALLENEHALAIEPLLARLPTRADAPIAPAELSAYGQAIGTMTGGKEMVRVHLGDDRLGARLVALASFSGDRETLAPHEKDSGALPRCTTKDPCEWSCDGAPITTVGAWVRECLEAPPREKPQLRGGHETPTLALDQMLQLLGDGGSDGGVENGAAH